MPSARWAWKCNIENGRIKEQNFDTYRLPRMRGVAAVVDVHFLDTNYPPTGVGEPAFPPACPRSAMRSSRPPATRIRTLPITREGFSIA